MIVDVVRRGLPGRPWALALILIALTLVVALRGTARGNQAFAMANHPAEAGFSVMTYNVEGLPWPVRLGRAEKLVAIGERLAHMRQQGRQPRVLLLQEAFSDDARAIRALAGYRHAAYGPAADMRAPAAFAPDPDFEAAGSLFKGERSGKLLDSGLIILSDYPIVSVRTEPFPVCAGYDCLANKGMMIAMIAVPGAPVPIALVNLHMNARKASGVSYTRANAAYRRQAQALRRFLDQHAAGLPTIVAGDFNIGRSAARRAMVRDALAWRDGGAPSDVLSACASASTACQGGLPADAQRSMRRAKDWQFLLGGGGSEWRVRRVVAPFGREKGGGMLSDHVGYTAYLELSPRLDRAITLASR